MTGIDTNVLVRYLTQDDASQARKAAKFIAGCTQESPAFVNRIVICELVWVLESGYGYPRAQVSLALERILRTLQFRIEDRSEAWAAFHVYQSGGDFADALVAAGNKRLGCEHTVTFDRKAAQQLEFLLL